MALKRIKYMFGKRSRPSQACIAKLTKGKLISNDDDDASLLEFWCTMSDCIVALSQKSRVKMVKIDGLRTHPLGN